MGKLTKIIIIALFCGLLTGRSGFADTAKLNDEQQKQWLRHLIPLPHEISIPTKMVLSPADIIIKTRPEAGAVEKNAALELESLFERKTGAVPKGEKFEILIGIADGNGKLLGFDIENIDKLREAPNSDQAYIIQPAGNEKLLLAGLSEKGVYYAAVTLRSLLEPVTTGDKTEIPLMQVVDWPDFAERGLWNSNSEDIVMEQAAETKLNFSRMLRTQLKVGKERSSAEIDVATMQKAVGKAVNFMPAITHLNFLWRTGLFDVFPELKGKGDSAYAGQYHAHGGAAKRHPAPCASNPLLTKVLAEWLEDIAAAGSPEAGCWLTERPAQCGCDTCMSDGGQFVWESRAFVNAWKEVREKHPEFIIRIFVSTTTDENYAQLLAELPEGVKIERACALDLERQRAEPRDVFLNQRIDPFAAKGLWVATYDFPVTVNGKVETPEFKLPSSSAHRMRDFLRQMKNRNYSGVYGMLAFSKSEQICALNIAALAEWSWNLDGRTEKEFAAAWATRAGYKNPVKFAEWSEMMGPVEFDVYDSGFPECYAWGFAVKMIENKEKPVFGNGMFRYYADEKAFSEKKGICRTALEIAKGFDDPFPMLETSVVMSYIELAEAIYEIAEKNHAGADQAELNKSLEQLKQVGAANVAAIKNWRSKLGLEPWHNRVQKAVKATEDTVAGITELLGGAE